MKTRIRSWAAVLIFTSTTAMAASGSGNGGDGVLLQGKPYLLDLVEAGLEQSPSFSPETALPEIQARVSNALANLGFESDLPARKLTEIKKSDPLFFRVLLQTMEFYSWYLVPRALIDIADEDPAVQIDPSLLVQLALRRERSIRIDRDYWRQLDDGNKTALLFHEIVYALTPPKDGLQSSPRAREVTAYLFSRQLQDRGNQGLQALLAPEFPTLSLADSRTTQYKERPGSIWTAARFDFSAESHDHEAIGKIRRGFRFHYVRGSSDLQAFLEEARAFCESSPSVSSGVFISIQIRADETTLSFAPYANSTYIRNYTYYARDLGTARSGSTWANSEECKQAFNDLATQVRNAWTGFQE